MMQDHKTFPTFNDIIIKKNPLAIIQCPKVAMIQINIFSTIFFFHHQNFECFCNEFCGC